MNKLYTLAANQAGKTRIEKFKGRDHIVAPIRLMIEGVFSGMGLPPLLHTSDTLEQSTETWNGIPIVVLDTGHPVNSDGVPISANDPQTLEKVEVGTLFNAKFEDRGISAEVWADLERIKKISPKALEGLRAMKLGSSIGSYFGLSEDSGSFNGKAFEGTVTSYIPNHLALLTDLTGGCSLRDGCGILSMMGGECPTFCDKRESTPDFGVVPPDLQAMTDIKSPGVKGFWKKIAALMKPEICKCGGGCADHTTDKEEQMKKNIAALVDGLIADTKNKLSEDNREFLGTLSEDQLTGIGSLKAMQADPKADPKTDSKAGDEGKKVDVVTFESLMATAPQEVKEQLALGASVLEAKRTDLVGKIKDNPNNNFDDKTLGAMSLDMLSSVAAVAHVPQDYSGNAGNFNMGAYTNDEEPLKSEYKAPKKEGDK